MNDTIPSASSPLPEKATAVTAPPPAAPTPAPPEPEPAPEPAVPLAAVPDLPDGLELLDSGRVRFTIDGNVYTLRAPLLGEIKAFRVQWAAVGASQPDEDGKDRRDALDVMYGDLHALWTETFKMLGDRRFPDRDPDELPGWLFSSFLPNQIFAHWQAVPLRPGSR